MGTPTLQMDYAAIGIDLKSGDPRLAGSDHPHDVDRL